MKMICTNDNRSNTTNNGHIVLNAIFIVHYFDIKYN